MQGFIYFATAPRSLVQSPSLMFICLDCLFSPSFCLCLLVPLRAESSEGCKVLLFPQLLSIIPVTTQLSISSTSAPYWADRACWHTNTHIKKEGGCGGGGTGKMKRGILSAPAGSHRRICRDTDAFTLTYTLQGTSCVGTTLISAIFTQPPSMSPSTMLSYRVSKATLPPNCRNHLAAAENHAARHTSKKRHGGSRGQSYRSHGKSEVKQFHTLICQHTPKVRYFL